jgi:hypothetical protein
MRYLSILITVFFSIIMGSCQSKINKQMKETFYWSPVAGCAPLYPMETYHCEFVYADGTGDGPATSRIGARNWGDGSGISVVGDEFKPVPVGLDITWLSYTENKFYTGSFELPYDSILHLFQKGFENFMWNDDTKTVYEKHDTYDQIIAGIAPGGVVVVWLKGARKQVEVARFQAKETSVDMKDFMQRDDLNVTKEQYAKSMIEDDTDVTDNLAKNGISYGLWDRYRDRFNMRVVVKYDQYHEVNTDRIDIGFYNGEHDVLFLDRLYKNQFAKIARINEMGINWSDTLGFKKQPYYLGIEFNEAEMFKAYKEVFGDNPNQEGELVVEVNRGNDQYQVFLQTKNNKVELLQDKGEIYFAQ